MRSAISKYMRRFSTSSLAYEFDLNGFAVLRNVFDESQVKTMNSAIDGKVPVEREGEALKNAKSGSYFDAKGSRMDLGGCMLWEETDVFRDILVAPRVTELLDLVVGKEHRLDHEPLILIQQKDSEGFKLHGGPMLDDGLNPELQYRTANGKIFNSLVALFVALTPSNGRNDGGLSLLRGSHKSSFATPSGYIHGEDNSHREFLDEHLYTPSLNPGDVVVFSEATVHGARPWRAEHERRVVLLRFSPRNFAYGRSIEVPKNLTPEQAKLFREPYSARLDNREKEKLDHDNKVFGHEYF